MKGGVRAGVRTRGSGERVIYRPMSPDPRLHDPGTAEARRWSPLNRGPGGLGMGLLTSMLMKIISMSSGLRNRCRGFMKCCGERREVRGGGETPPSHPVPQRRGTRTQSQRQGSKDGQRTRDGGRKPARGRSSQQPKRGDDPRGCQWMNGSTKGRPSRQWNITQP